VFNCDGANSLNIEGHAEWEMAAFLKATTELLGPSGRLQAADAWFHAMESLNWPNDNHQKFFRSVSIRAISTLLADSSTNVNDAKPGNNQSAAWMPALQAAH
jgi:hypothetical protein